MPALQVVTLKEIQEIFVVTDRIGISREALVIPLKPKNPGSIKKTPGGKIEIIVDATQDFRDWLGGLEPKLRSL